MGFPSGALNWLENLDAFRKNFAQVVQAIAQFETVSLLVQPEQLALAQKYCGTQNIEFICLPYDDVWLRDTGPTFIIDGKKRLAGVNWKFNAWAENQEKIEDYQQDVQLATAISAHRGIPCYAAPLVLEGGAIYADGEGTLLATEQCLLHPDRNPQFSKCKIEAYLRNYLNVSKVIWLKQGLQDDETTGHIDNLATFVRPGVVLALSSDDPQDANYLILQENLRQLRAATDAQGRHLEVIEIAQPARREYRGLRMTLSYINFYLANGGIVMPTFDDPKDDAALATLRDIFPQHQIIPLNILEILRGGGGIHCMTQQEPLPNILKL
jgi:agmatine deiminase